jgi:hypothetical protein
MKVTRILVLILGCAICTFGQDAGNVMYQTSRSAVSVGAFPTAPAGPVTGAPYSATITNEMTQTLEDGSHIVQKTNGAIARDSGGRTRQDAPLPTIGNLSAANAPHIVFLQDPVGQVSYTLDLTNKVAQKMTMPPGGSAGAMVSSGPAGAGMSGPVFMMRVERGASTANEDTMLPPIALQKAIASDDPAQVSIEDLGSQTMEGVIVTGTRTTRVIPAGQIGNDAPISIVTEVWTSSELKTVVYSKRSDPRMGVQKFELTDIVRTEPDASLFVVPADFKVVDGPQPIVYRSNP